MFKLKTWFAVMIVGMIGVYNSTGDNQLYFSIIATLGLIIFFSIAQSRISLASMRNDRDDAS